MSRAWAIFSTVSAILLAAGWLVREQSFAEERNKLLQAQTVTLGEIKLADYDYEGTPRGKVGIYFSGDTAGTSKFVVGQFRLRPGEEPHPIHKHPEEEILIVTQGKGEISCAGKTTKVGPGSVMYTGPNDPHGIKNTGKDELVFYFIKYIGGKK
ncbi:MAG: hypothetical protein KatS3mg105_2561 [Gemmatales bacterium]|nr:MAG: hypothetical protein KatS3mg105_2561 [Gemmatales bacterium]